MPVPLAALGGTPLVVGLAGVYVTIGAGIGATLARRGHGAGPALAALVAWPLLLPALDRDRAGGGSGAGGPLATRIAAVFDALRETLTDPAAAEVAWEQDADELREALLRADRRLALVDRLLAQESAPASDEVAASLAGLRDARARAAEEIEAVLAEVTRLRIQVGLTALAGDTAPIAERLRELRARARAIEEVADTERAPGEGPRAAASA